MANQYSHKPPELKHVTYAQLEPIWEQLTELRDAVLALQVCTDAVDAYIAWEQPTEKQVQAAVEAIEQLPDVAARLEAVVNPTLIHRLMRRCARLRGVTAPEFDSRKGTARFG